MLVKETTDSINFIDEHDNFVGYQLSQICCEQATWAIVSEQPTNKKKAIQSTVQPEELEGYYLDTRWFKQKNFKDTDTDAVIFRMKKDKHPHRYIVFTNTQNGYYSHGYTCSIGGQVWKSGKLW